MTVVARTLASLSPAARTAVWTYVETAAKYDDNPMFAPVARLSVLIRALVAAGGTHDDLDALIALHEPAFEDFLNHYHAETVWRVYAPIADLVPEGAVV